MSTNELASSATSGIMPADAYVDPPWWYDIRGFFILKLSYRSSLWSQISSFEKNLSDRHLEVAVGTGTLLRYILRWRRWRGGSLPERIVAFDYSETMLESARRKFLTWPGIELQQGDAADLSYSDESFDSINIANAFHCFPDADRTLREMHRVLAPGGSLAMNVLLHPRGGPLRRSISRRINAWGIRKGILHTPYDLEDVRARLRTAGFATESEGVIGNAYFVRARKLDADLGQ